jgi:hypothetical protein
MPARPALDSVQSGHMHAASDNPGSPAAVYAARAEAFRTEVSGLTERFNRLANLRLVAFIAAAACLMWGFSQGGPAAIGGGLILAVVFLVLVRQHRLIGLRRERVTGLHAINVEAGERLARRWQNVPLRHAVEPDRQHPYAGDLDLFGHGSLLHLLDTTRTSMGQTTLALWLLDGANPNVVRERQRAVAELSARLDFCQELELRGVLHGAARADPEPLLAWAEGEPWLLRRRGLLWASRISPLLLCGLAVAQATGLLDWPLWLPFLFLNALLWQLIGKQAYATLSSISVQEGGFRQYAASLGLLATTPVEAPLLERLLGRLTAAGRSAYAHMRDLERTTRLVLPRGAQVYWVLQTILLWDVHVLAALEGWQNRTGKYARAWLETLGDIEALAALAALAHAHPDWTMPDIDEAACQVEAEQAGHPLLPPGVRVDNDVALGPPGRFLLVTGSNMAGKSTFLRTIGTNIVLAQAGGPVCARSFRLPPLALCTTMRVVDSLERGVSTFLAEVLRLKQVVDAARADHAGRSLCYLLDEILQGTNTAERLIAARQVIHFLLEHGAIGAVSTHDLTLADTPELDPRAQRVHFSETLTAGPAGPIMTFDYQLQPGLATSTNALRLVALLGLQHAGQTPTMSEFARGLS